MPDSNNVNEIIDHVEDTYIQTVPVSHEAKPHNTSKYPAAFDNAIKNLEYDIIYVQDGDTFYPISKHEFVPKKHDNGHEIIYTLKNDTLFATDYTPLGATSEVLIFGMAGIFVFMTIFYILVKVLEKAFKNDANKE